jgi:hypothetical protein
MKKDWKFVPISTKEAQILADDHLKDLDTDALIPIHKDEFEDLNNQFNYNLDWNTIPTVQPIGRTVAYLYGANQFVMMTEEEFYKEIS